MLDRIDFNISSALDNVDEGNKQLAKSSIYQKKAISKTKYLLGGLVGIAAVVGTILGIKLK